jgi:HSP20 family molecular chaperone IbpA
MAVLMVRDYPSILDEVRSLVDRSWSFTLDVTDFRLNMNMVEDKDELVVMFDLPGVKKGDIDVTIYGNILHINAERKMPELSKDARYYTCEQYSGSYSRSVQLPFSVNTIRIGYRPDSTVAYSR